MNRKKNPLHFGLLALVVGAVLAACGGGQDQADAEALSPLPGVQLASAGAGAGLLGPTELRDELAPLIADDGSAMPSLPSAEPADAGARTRQGRYALREQAESLAAALPGRVIWVDAGCCGADAAEGALIGAHAEQLALDLDAQAPVFVTGRDARAAAAAANRLADAGFGRVFVVTR